MTTIFFTMSTILWKYCSRTKKKSWCKVKTYGNPVIHILLMQIFVLCVTVSDSFSGLISELLLSRVTLLLVRWVLLTHYTTWEQGILIMGSGKKFEFLFVRTFFHANFFPDPSTSQQTNWKLSLIQNYKKNWRKSHLTVSRYIIWVLNTKFHAWGYFEILFLLGILHLEIV